MSDERNDQNGPLLIIGGLLIVAGGWLMARQFGIIPEPLYAAWDLIRASRGAIALVLIGIVVIVLAGRGGTMTMPSKGTRLYRSRDDKWVSGVLGGLARYLGIDAVLLRIAFLALVFLGNFGSGIVAYIILAIVIPEEPKVPQVG